jgi:hypothetical protein
VEANQEQELERARQARDKLAEQYLYQPGISLIDIGLDPQDFSGTSRLVLRVHLKSSVSAQALNLPAEIDGIPVRILTGNYRLE